MSCSIPYVAGFCSVQLSCQLSRAKHHHRRSPADKSPSILKSQFGQQVLQEYLDARLSGNWARSYELVITDKTQESYIKDSEAQAPLAGILGPASTFEILEVTLNQNTVVATASIQMPDLTPFIQKLIMMGVKAEMLGRTAQPMAP